MTIYCTLKHHYCNYCYLQGFQDCVSRLHPGSEFRVLAKVLQLLSPLSQHRVQGATVCFRNLPSHRNACPALTELGHCHEDPALGFTAGVLRVQQFGQQPQDCGRFKFLPQMGVFTEDLCTAERGQKFSVFNRNTM